ncbi:hypothetical protein BDR07DRAFT_1382812 [Suillus spraguei]|nr:hypothetical protein BDR07DRAFT_1382812 [Suillus spraguei]
MSGQQLNGLIKELRQGKGLRRRLRLTSKSAQNAMSEQQLNGLIKELRQGKGLRRRSRLTKQQLDRLNKELRQVIKHHDLATTHDILKQKFLVEKNGTTIRLVIDKKSMTVPSQCYDALWLLHHHLNMYRRTANALMDDPGSSNATLDTYLCITYYYCEVLMAFFQEVKDDAPAASKTWRSAHLDYHFAMALNNNAFNKAYLERFQTEEDLQTCYAADKVTIDSYHKEMCNGKNMCGLPSIDHSISVEDMIAAIITPESPSTTVAVEADKAEKKVHFGSAADVNRQSNAGSTSKSVKITVGPIQSAKSASTAPHVEDDDVDHVADMFNMKNDGHKSHKNEKGGRQAQATRTVFPMEKNEVNNAPNAAGRKQDEQSGLNKRKGGRRAKEALPSTRIDGNFGRDMSGNDVSWETLDNVALNISTQTARGSGKEIVELDNEDVSIDDAIISQSAASHEPSPANPTANVEFEVEDESSNAKPYKMVQNFSEITAPEADTDEEIDELDLESDLVNNTAASRDLGNSQDIQFPSTFEDWAKWNRITFEKGNSHIFLKLGTWILLRFRQLAKTPLYGDVDGLLIPEHPRSLPIEHEGDFNEALGMTCLYSALAHIETHPECLVHIFHEIGKSSSEGLLGRSHPGVRSVPELPIPVHSMMSDKQWPWLHAFPFEEDVHTDERGAEGDTDEGDGGVSISMALDDMVISGPQDSADISDGQEAQKRKRTISNALSPPKTEGGRGFTKRSRASTAEPFIRPSSPIMRSLAAVASTKSVYKKTTQKQPMPTEFPYPSTQRKFFSLPITQDKDMKSGSETLSNLHLTRASESACDNGAQSDISTWSESEVDSRMQAQILSQSDPHEEAENIDNDTENMSVTNMVSMEESDGEDEHYSGDQDTGRMEVETSGSRATSEPSTGVESRFDEDVRVLVPSTPE